MVRLDLVDQPIGIRKEQRRLRWITHGDRERNQRRQRETEKSDQGKNEGTAPDFRKTHEHKVTQPAPCCGLVPVDLRMRTGDQSVEVLDDAMGGPITTCYGKVGGGLPIEPAQ